MKKYINLENWAYVAVFLLPLYLLRFNVFGAPANAWEVLAMGGILLGWRRIISLFKAGAKKYFWPFLLIIFGFLISILAGKNYAVGFGIIKSWLILPFFFAFLSGLVVRKEKRKNIYLAYYFSAFFVAVVSLGFYFSNHLTFDGRLRGIFNSPNYLAMYLAPAVIIYVFGKEKPRLKKYFAHFSLGAILFSLYLTFSYAAWGALVAAVSGVFLAQGRLNAKKVWVISGIFFIFAIFQFENNKFSDLINFDSRSSLSSRIMIWNSAGKILGNHWILGIGPGNFQRAYLEYQKYFPPYLEWAVPHPHNVFLAFWLSGGVLGFFGFLWLLVIFFGDVWKKIRRVETRQGLVSTDVLHISVGIMLYILIHGLFDTTYFKNDLAVVFWLTYFLGGESLKIFQAFLILNGEGWRGYRETR